MKLPKPTYQSLTWINLLILIGSVFTIAGFNCEVNATSLEIVKTELLDSKNGNSSTFFYSYSSSYLKTIQSSFNAVWFDKRIRQYHNTIKRIVMFKMSAANYLKFKSNVLEVQLYWGNLRKGRENNTEIQLG